LRFLERCYQACSGGAWWAEKNGADGFAFVGDVRFTDGRFELAGLSPARKSVADALFGRWHYLRLAAVGPTRMFPKKKSDGSQGKKSLP